MPPASEVLSALRKVRLKHHNEIALQDGIEQALKLAFVDHAREVRLSDSDRIDFMAGDVGIEVKVQGGAAEVERQLERYAETGRVSSLILVTTKAQHAARIPRKLAGVDVIPFVVMDLA